MSFDDCMGWQNPMMTPRTLLLPPIVSQPPWWNSQETLQGNSWGFSLLHFFFRVSRSSARGELIIRSQIHFEQQLIVGQLPLNSCIFCLGLSVLGLWLWTHCTHSTSWSACDRDIPLCMASKFLFSALIQDTESFIHTNPYIFKAPPKHAEPRRNSPSAFHRPDPS